MADKRITELAPLDAVGVQSTVDVLAIADVSAAETKKITAADAVAAGITSVADGSIPGSKIESDSITAIQLAPDSVGSSELADNAVDTAAIQNLAVTTGKLASGSVNTGKLADGSVTAEKIAGGVIGATEIADRSITAAKLVENTLTHLEIAPDAIRQSELADDAVAQENIQDGAVGTNELIDLSVITRKLSDASVTGDKLANSSVDSNHIVAGAVDNSHLASGIDGTKLLDSSVTDAKLSGEINGGRLSAGSVANGSLASGIDGAKLLDDSVANSKLSSGIDGAKLSAGSVPGTAIAGNSLTADQIALNAIGASELADAAVDTAAISDNAISTPKLQDASVTDAKLASGIDGSKLIDGSITVQKLANGAVTDDKIDGIGLDKLPNAGPGTVLAGPASGVADSPSYRPLQSTDIPTATATTKGGVTVPSTGGLSVDAGSIGIANGVTPGGFPFVNFDDHGLITGGRALSGSDLPPPALNDVGAVKAGDGITIATDGTLSQSVTGVVAGTYPKVVVDARGNVTEGQQLVADDIPTLDATKIENLLVGTDVLVDRAVTRQKLADYSITFIQEAQPAVDTSVHIGCLWFQESTATLSMWNGNSFMSVGIGRLSQENLRYCGVFDATTGLITGVTQFGVTEGFEIGETIPNASDGFTGVYFLCEVAGSNVGVTPAIQFDVGDWILCNGAAAGWIRVDIAAGGGGGGGGVTRLSELLDVSVSSASAGAILQLQDSGQWVDVYSLDGGTF